MIPVPRTMMRASSSAPRPLPMSIHDVEPQPEPEKRDQKEDQKEEDQEEDEQQPVASRPDHVGLCGRPRCIRTRALLAAKPQVVYRPIEQIRIYGLSWWWLASLVIALGWSVACVQKKQVLLGIVNFLGAFLPLWRQVYVQTPYKTVVLAWVIMVGTFYLL